ncbi:MAG: hypothetical protein R2849_00050 [Thermomicrobiales bacterium]
MIGQAMASNARSSAQAVDRDQNAGNRAENQQQGGQIPSRAAARESDDGREAAVNKWNQQE